MDEGVVEHMRGGEGFACKVSYPITELVVMSHDEAALLTIQVVTYRKFSVAAITVSWEFWRLYAVSQKEGFVLILRP